MPRDKTPADQAYEKFKTMFDSPHADTSSILLTVSHSDLYDLVQGYGKMRALIDQVAVDVSAY